MDEPNTIPSMTDAMGGGWRQPSPDEIIIDNADNARMTSYTWSVLAEYTTTNPTGVYEGKMWRSSGPAFLWWYGPSDKPEHCKVNRRAVTISDNIRREDGRVCRLFPEGRPSRTAPIASTACGESAFFYDICPDAATCMVCVAQGATR